MRPTPLLVVLLLVAAAVPALASADDGEQGFLRVVEGDATLVRVEDGEPEEALANLPVLPGDRLWLERGARVEVILPDAHRVRLGDRADLELAALARSLDVDSEVTVLALRRGALALDVPDEGLDRTRIDAAAATFYLEPGGLYLIETDESGWTSVVVRAGEAEMVTPDDALLVRAGEQAETTGRSADRIAVFEAPALADVELWAAELEEEARRADLDALEDPHLRYAATPLARHGSWLYADGGRAWRPRVAADWRPYWDGYWTHSPAGLVWASYEPWGWVPYHYGVWDLHPAYGWIWYPGRAYAPAHVVWSWSGSHVAWVPSGYYRNHYARRFGFHVSFGTGFFGVSHADWRAYRHWNFCPTTSLGFRHQRRFHRDHRAIAFDGHGSRHRRAFITADTRGIERGRWTDPSAVEGAVLRRAHRRTGSEPGLRDVSAIIARSDDVSSTVLRDIDRAAGDVPRVAAHRPAGGLRGRPVTDASRRGAGAADSTPHVERDGVGAGVDARAHRPVGERTRPPEARPGVQQPRVLAGRGGGGVQAGTGTPGSVQRRTVRRAESPGIRTEPVANAGRLPHPGSRGDAPPTTHSRAAVHRAPAAEMRRDPPGGDRSGSSPSAGRHVVRRSAARDEGDRPRPSYEARVIRSRSLSRASGGQRPYPSVAASRRGPTAAAGRRPAISARATGGVQAPRPPAVGSVRARGGERVSAPAVRRVERSREIAAPARAARAPRLAPRAAVVGGGELYGRPRSGALASELPLRPRAERANAPPRIERDVARGYRQAAPIARSQGAVGPRHPAAPGPRAIPQGPRGGARLGEPPAQRGSSPVVARSEGARAPRAGGSDTPRASAAPHAARTRSAGGPRTGGSSGGGHRAARRN